MNEPLLYSDLTPAQRDHAGTLDAIRWLSVKAESRGATSRALDRFEDRWPNAIYSTTIRLERKAAVAAGSTLDPSWAGALVKPPAPAPITAAVDQESVLGKIRGLSRVPFATAIPVQTGLGKFVFVGQGSPKPVSQLAYTPHTLPAGKIAGILIRTDELMRLQTPATERAVRDGLVAEIAGAVDTLFLDPAHAPVANVSPGAITNGIAPVAGTGDLAADLTALLGQFFTQRPRAVSPVLLMTAASASGLAPTEPHLTVEGGFARGIRTVVTPGAGNQIVVIDARGVLVASDEVVLDVSRYAAVQMDDAPDNPPTGATVLRDLWSHNEVGIAVEQPAWWVATPTSVQVLALS